MNGCIYMSRCVTIPRMILMQSIVKPTRSLHAPLDLNGGCQHALRAATERHNHEPNMHLHVQLRTSSKNTLHERELYISKRPTMDMI